MKPLTIKMKRLILKVLVQIIYRFSERTPSDIKYSEKNYRVANAVLAVGELAKLV